MEKLSVSFVYVSRVGVQNFLQDHVFVVNEVGNVQRVAQGAFPFWSCSVVTEEEIVGQEPKILDSHCVEEPMPGVILHSSLAFGYDERVFSSEMS